MTLGKYANIWSAESGLVDTNVQLSSDVNKMLMYDMPAVNSEELCWDEEAGNILAVGKGEKPEEVDDESIVPKVVGWLDLVVVGDAVAVALEATLECVKDEDSEFVVWTGTLEVCEKERNGLLLLEWMSILASDDEEEEEDTTIVAFGDILRLVLLKKWL